MSKNEIFVIIANVINDVTGISIDEIHEDSSLMEDIELSSLEIMTIIAEIETRTMTRIPVKVLPTFIYINDIVEYIYNC